MSSPGMDSTAVDDAAAQAFATELGEAARALPPVAIVIAAFNEADVIGQVIEALPATICGLKTAVLVVSDGSKDKTAGAARTHGALVCDVPVNRGQGAALRLGYRLAREGGAAYIVTTDADGRYNPAEDFPRFPVDTNHAPGCKHSSIEEARDDSDADGTRSILDVTYVREEPDYDAVAPVREDELMEFFGTTKPSAEDVEDCDDLFDSIERGQGVYVVLYEDDEPSQIFFAGYSYD